MATAALIKLEPLEKNILLKILNARNATGNDLKIRVQIVLAAAENLTNRQIQNQYGIEEHRVATWRNRFHEHHEFWKLLDPDLRPKMNEKLIRSWLADSVDWKVQREEIPTLYSTRPTLHS